LHECVAQELRGDIPAKRASDAIADGKYEAVAVSAESEKILIGFAEQSGFGRPG
jgi:hypothetical protein